MTPGYSPTIAIIISRNIVRFLLVTFLAALPSRTLSKTVVDLQTSRTQSAISFDMQDGGTATATLINLQPQVNAWYLLRLMMPDSTTSVWHLENPFPDTQELRLDPDHPHGLVIVTGRQVTPCELWQTIPSKLSTASQKIQAYVPLCDGRVLLRNPTVGSRSRKEWAADFVRDRTRYGDQITRFFKDTVFRDRYFSSAKRRELSAARRVNADSMAPPPLNLVPEAQSVGLTPHDLGIQVHNPAGREFIPGDWYPVKEHPGVFLALVTPDLVAASIVAAEQKRVKPLDKVEEKALTYLVAWDLAQFDIGFSIGTEHPRVNWSERINANMREANTDGPDGFGTIAPLVRTGMVQPFLIERVAATITGGFKREHGAFKYGEFAGKNAGSHNGFLENGVLLSTLQPGLSTFLVDDKGRVDMKTWTATDQGDVPRLRHARQNGVPLVETDASGQARAGRLVGEWSAGNWSGSETKQQRTLRAGLGLVESGGRRFLVFGYFSSVTPNAMALTFLACGAKHAMHLDMNAPEHTYVALYKSADSSFDVQRLVNEMAELDFATKDGSMQVPRYVGYPDTRDFFYVLRKKQSQVP